LLSTSQLDPTSIFVFEGHLSGGKIIIDVAAPGYTDKGNAVNDVILLKPTTHWANTVAAATNAMATFTKGGVDWVPFSVVPTVTANNGQREHQLTFAGVDYTGTISPGTKLKIPRTSTVPTQSAQFVAASSQYASKASPTGITFTSDFTCEAWIYLVSYPTGTNFSTIISKTDGSTGGFNLLINSSGQVRQYYGASSAFTDFISYQSIPLNKWTHVAVAATVAGKTAGLYIDGVSVPYSQSATAATTLTQVASNLSIGAQNTGAAGSLFNGQIAHARIWSVARTAQNIRDNANKSMTGSETGLVGSWSLNGDFTDKTANANTLTASGGAIATYADNPWKATEYAIVTAISYAGSNTVATIFSGSNAIPNETLGTTSYSSARSPYGFPASRAKWSIIIYFTNFTASAVSGTWTSPITLVTPTGDWIGRYHTDYYSNRGAAINISHYISLSTSATSESNAAWTTVAVSGTGSGVTYLQSIHTITGSLSVPTATNYYLIGKTVNSDGGGVGGAVIGSSISSVVLEPAYL
jgi:hypothetical protein